MDEAFQVETLGTGFAHAPDFVDGQLTRQDDAVRAQGFGLSQRFGMGQIGQGGQKQPALEPGLPGQIQHGQILDDQAVRVHLPGQTCGQTIGGGAFAGLDQGVHGHVDARVFGVGQIREPGQFGKAEVFRLHAGGEVFQAQIDGVGSGGQGGQKGGRVPGRGEDFGLARRGGLYVLCAHIL